MLGRPIARARHEFRLGTRELVFLSLAFLAVWGLSFALGILVGRELSGPGPGAERVAETAPSSPRSAEPKGPPHERLTFYRTLTAPTVELPSAEKGIVEERMVTKGDKAQDREMATAASAPSPAGPWTVQVSAFRSRALAEDLRRQLAAKGYDAYLVAVESEDGRVRYRVRVGSFATRGEADQAAARLRTERHLNPFVTTRAP